MTKFIYIVRHGNTFDKGDIVTRVGGRTDLPLSGSGHVQVAGLAQHFAELNLNFTTVLSSPLTRTKQTAEAIIATQEIPVEIETCDFLREIDYGIDENAPEADVIARIGQNALALWERSAILPDGWHLDIAALVRAWRQCFQAIANSKKPGPTLIVTSNGIARFALQLAKQGSDHLHTLKLATAAYGELGLDEDGAITIRSWNCRP